MIDQLAHSTANLLVLGESGVGKKRVAETIHRRSGRSTKPFLCIDCETLSEALVRDESDARLLQVADAGTVFLDEVSDLGLPMQALIGQLLTRIAASGIVRVIAATERNLGDEVHRGRFQDQLLAQLNGVCIRIAPLRDRKHEIRPLAEEFASAVQSSQRVSSMPRISQRAVTCLEAYPWPGNVRELRRTIERATSLSCDHTIEPHHLDIAGFKDVPSANDERQKIQGALSQTAGNQTLAAALLGISRATFVRRLDAYELPRPRNPREGRSRSTG